MAFEYFKSVFTGFIAGNIIALILNQWIFLEMRVNTNSVIPLSAVACAAFFHFSKIIFQVKYILALELLFGFLVLLLYKFSFESCRIIPASMFRDAFHLASFSLGEVNAVLLSIFVTANFPIFRELTVKTFPAAQIDED